jgi:HEAT repeat protein
MKNSQFVLAGPRSWLKTCLYLFATLFLVLTPFLLARGQSQTPNISRSQNGLSELKTKNQREVEEFFEAGFSTTNLFVLLGLAAISLLVVRKVRQFNENDAKIKARVELTANEGAGTRRHRESSTRASQIVSRANAINDPVSTPNSIYSAYRIEQNVIKLVTGDRYNCEVLSSRAPDDRRAIEAFLNKVITSSVSSADEIARARSAMETYGFVARHSSSLLMAPEPFERTDAARSLGEIGSPRALPFLLEALHDSEQIVRNHAVVSLGQLGIPAAIGPLLERATRQPELPLHLVSRALSACSVEVDRSLEGENLPSMQADQAESCDFDLGTLLSSVLVEDLPDDSDDEDFNELLDAALSEDVLERIAAVKGLSQYPAKTAVDWLVAVSRNDVESNVRSVAISSLAFIDHESVLPAVLLAMADESRDVRAAAARAFSRLSFDRSKAYFHFFKTADDETVRTVGSACLRAGILTQNIDRLASYDRFQTVETFALICLLARAQLVDSVIEIIASHSNVKVRTAAVGLLASTRQPYLIERFEDLTKIADLHVEVGSAILEGIEKLKRSQVETEELERTEVVPLPEPPKKALSNETVSEISLNEFVTSDSDSITESEVSQDTPSEITEEKEIVLFATDLSDDVRRRLHDPAAGQRAGALADLARSGGDQAFELIADAFDDPSPVVRNAAARALFQLGTDPAESFARALRAASGHRSRHIGFAIASSGLASDAISNLHRRSINQTHNALALLFLMTRAGEVQPLLKAIDENSATDTRVTCVKLLALSGQFEALAAFKRLSLRASLPNEVRSALMEGIYQLSTHS